MVVCLAYRVLCSEPNVLRRVERVVETRPRKRRYRIVFVMHALYNAAVLAELIYRLALCSAVGVPDRQLAFAARADGKLGVFVHVAVGVTRYRYRLSPGRDIRRYAFYHYWRTKDRPVECGAYSSVGRKPHLGELVFLHALSVGRYRGALDAHSESLDSLRRVGSDLIGGAFAVFQPEVVKFRIQLDVRLEQ